MHSLKLKQIRSYFITLALIAVTGVTGCSSNTNPSALVTPSPSQTVSTGPISKSSFKLNTIITITLYDSIDESIIDECFALCDIYENLFSRTIDSSEISQINNSTGTVKGLSDDTLDLIQKGIYYGELSQGAFDITLEPITSLWSFGSNDQRVPSREEITTALTHIGYQNLILKDNSITLLKDGMGIDLGAIAKGYIADKIKEYLLSRSVTSATINLGGNVLCIGEKPDGSPFHIGIQKPYEDRSETIAVMKISDMSIVSSGIYERYFVADGVNYHHLLSPFTGYPFDNNLVSVTIISEKSTDGDALSTTCFALGLEKGLELINSLENTYAAFITKDEKLHYSKGFKDNITLIEADDE